jgi:hypothetical protein
MPVITGQIDSYNVPENARDVSQAFSMIAFPNTPLFNEIAIPGTVRDTTHNWWDHVRQPIKTTLGAGYTADGGTLTVVSSAGLRVGSIVKVNAVVYRVTVINSATSIDVVVADGGDDADATSGDDVIFIGDAEVEGKEYVDSDYTQKVARSNVTQIFTDFVKFTGTQQAITREVRQGDILLQEIQDKLERLYLYLARAVWNNPKVTAATNASARVMGGIDYFIDTYGYAPTAATFNAANFDTFLLDLELEYGGMVFEAWMNPLEMAHFSALDSTALLINREDNARGVHVTRYISKYGHEVTLRTDPQAPVGPIYVFNKNAIRLMPLQGRQFQVLPLAKAGDNDKRQIVGEYTLEVYNSSTMGKFTPS